jgi:trimeric autotransporter adhesin
MNKPSSLPPGAFSGESARLYKIASIVLLLCLTAHPAHAQNAPVGGGGSCSYSLEPDGTVAQQQAFDDGLYTCLCSNSTWTPEAFIVGSTLASGAAATCNATNAGMLEYTGGVIEYCNGTSFSSTGNPTAGTIGASSGVLVELTQGTQQLPSLTFKEDTTTGIYQPAYTSHNMAVTTAGTERVLFDSSGNFNLLGAAAAYEINSTPVLDLPAADTTYSLAVGVNVLSSDSSTGGGNTGLYNTGLGYEALQHNTTGYDNTAFGVYDLQYETTSNNNTAFGAYAMQGVSATPLIGVSATPLYGANTAIGYEALMQAQGTAKANTAIGNQALETLTTGSYNTAIGYQAEQNDSGAADNDNVAIGYQALYNNAASNNVGIGYQALYQNSGGNNVAIGHQALYSVTTGSSNVAVGNYAMEYSTQSSTVAIGYEAMQGVSATPMSGTENTAVGTQALQNATTGSGNSAFGYQALLYLSTGSSNTAFGSSAMVGVSTTPLTGNDNTALGDSALHAIQGNANYNSALGYEALHILTAANDNTAMGYEAGLAITTGTDDTLVGYTAGNVVTGNYNIIVGEAGNITTGSTNIVIGNNLTQTTAGSSNQIDIGDNIMVYGDSHLAIHSTALTTANTGTTCPAAAATSISGNDQAFTVTQSSGAASTTLCVITFETTWIGTPVCVVSWGASGPPGVGISSVASTTTLTIYASTAETSKTINAVCSGYK